MTRTVVKVGGSLFDLPDLAERLRRFLSTLDGAIALVPGGGIIADSIRQFDRVHGLGDEASHWLALQACALNGHVLARLLPGTPIVNVPRPGLAIVDLHRFALADEERADHWPHHWDVTSDSMAVRVAKVFEASDLVLLKSTDWDGDDWRRAAAAGVVDRYIPTALERTRRLRVLVVNLRGVRFQRAMNAELRRES
jgi:aspartokinase-like uncharacterized kinase